MSKEQALSMQHDLAFLADRHRLRIPRPVVRLLCSVIRRRYRGPVTWDRTIQAMTTCTCCD